MKKLLIFIFILLSVNVFADCNVAVTSKLIECCVRDIGKEKVSVTCIVPVSACPGHIDLSPKDIKTAKNADFLFCHGFEPYAKKLGSRHTFSVCENKNMLIPKHYEEGLAFICAKLCEKDRKNSQYYKKNLNIATEKTKKLNAEIQKKAKKLKGKSAVCSVNCKPVLLYFGIDVIASFPIPDKITPKTWTDIYRKTKGRKTDFCVDNLQSGKNVCLQLSKDIKAKHIATSNFPGGYPNTDNMEKCLKYNLDLLLK